MLKRGGEILEEPEGEKPLKIGNADIIYTDCIPSQIQYTALGHLHSLAIAAMSSALVIFFTPFPSANQVMERICEFVTLKSALSFS